MSKKRRRRTSAESAVASAPLSPSQPARAGGFSPDYSHVVRDLKRIGLLAGTFIFLLLIGTLFIR